MTLHTFGDSHSLNGWSDIREMKNFPIKICIHHLGPHLMFTFGQRKLEFLDISKYDVKDGDLVVFCFGEIDCRCHIFKFKEDYKKVIRELVLHYMRAIEENIKNMLPSKVNAAVYSIPPTVELAKSESFNNKDFPFLGEDSDRQAYVCVMNAILREECFRRGYLFIDISDKYRDDNGFLVPYPTGDGLVHIKDPKHLIDFLNESVIGKVTTC